MRVFTRVSATPVIRSHTINIRSLRPSNTSSRRPLVLIQGWTLPPGLTHTPSFRWSSSVAMAQAPQDSVSILKQYTACDISDALLRLKVPGAGYLADIDPYNQPEGADAPITIAPASTVLFAPKGVILEQPAKNIPSDANWSDVTEPGTIAILRQPDGQKNAVCGGIMALRMKVRGVQGIVAVGRVRDLDELRSTGLPVGSASLQTSSGLMMAPMCRLLRPAILTRLPSAK